MKEEREQFTHRPVRTGAMTLLITAVLICLAVLAVLSLATARADLAMAERSLSGLQSRGTAEQQGQEYLAQLDAALKQGSALPEAAVQEDGSIRAELTLEDGTLRIVVQPKEPDQEDSAAYRILSWEFDSSWEPDQTLDLWNGM